MSGSEFSVETRATDLLTNSSSSLKQAECVSPRSALPPLSQILSLVTFDNLVGIGGIVNRSISKNPMADFDMVHIPYCDGAIFTGDTDRPLAYDMLSSKPKMAYQRGLQNLTAAFEVAKQKYPNPSRIVLAGYERRSVRYRSGYGARALLLSQ